MPLKKVTGTPEDPTLRAPAAADPGQPVHPETRPPDERPIDIMPYRESPYPHDLGSPGMRLWGGGVEGLSLGHAPILEGVRPPEGPGEIAAGEVGRFLGMAPYFWAGHAMGLPAPATMGAIGAAHPGTPQERLYAGLSGLTFGTGLKAVSPLARALGARVGGQIGAEAAAKTAASPQFRLPLDAAIFSGMNVQSGMPLQDVPWATLGQMGGMYAAPPSAFGREPHRAPGERLAKTPAEREAPRFVERTRDALQDRTVPQERQAQEVVAQERLPAQEVQGRQEVRAVDRALNEIDAVRASAEQPIPGSRVSEVLNEFKLGRESMSDLAARVSSSGIEGSKAKTRAKEIAKEVSAEKEAGEFEGSVSQEAEIRALREDLPPDYVDFVDNLKTRAELNEMVKEARDALPESQKRAARWTPSRAERYDEPRLWQDIGGGEPGYKNITDKYFNKVKHDVITSAARAKDELVTAKEDIMSRHNIKRNTPESEAVIRLIEAEREGLSPGTVEEMPWWTKAVKRVPAENIVGASREVRDLFDRGHAEASAVLEASGKEPIPYREHYAPWVQKTPGTIGRIKGAWKGEGNMRVVDEAIRDDTIEIGRAKPRGQGEGERDWDVHRNVETWADDVTKRSVFQLGMSHDFALARYAELRGHKDLAKLIRNYSQSDYADMSWGLQGQMDNATFGGGGPFAAFNQVAYEINRGLKDAVFTMNLGWNIGIQPTSTAQTLAGTGPKHSAAALTIVSDPKFRSLIRERGFVRTLKSRRGGAVAAQRAASGGDVLANRIANSRVDELRDAGQFVNRAIEDGLDIYSAAAWWSHGKSRGLKGRELLEYASDGAMRDQDFYTRQLSAQLVRSKALNTWAPFMRFGLGAVRNVQQNLGVRGGGLYRLNPTNAGRVKVAVQTAVAFYIANQWAAQFGRDAFGPATVPGVGYMTGSNVLFPVGAIDNARRVVADAEKGKYGQSVARTFRGGFVKGAPGALVSNIILTLEFTYGEDPPFRIPEEQMLIGMMVGPYNTSAGKKYRDERGGGGYRRIWVPDKKGDDEPEQGPLGARRGRTRSGRQGRPRGGRR